MFNLPKLACRLNKQHSIELGGSCPVRAGINLAEIRCSSSSSNCAILGVVRHKNSQRWKTPQVKVEYAWWDWQEAISDGVRTVDFQISTLYWMNSVMYYWSKSIVGHLNVKYVNRSQRSVWTRTSCVLEGPFHGHSSYVIPNQKGRFPEAEQCLVFIIFVHTV